MKEFTATHVTVERQSNTEIEEGKAPNYKIYGRKSDGTTEVFNAMALNLNGFAFSAQTMSIAEYNQTIKISQKTDGGYLNIEVKKQ